MKSTVTYSRIKTLQLAQSTFFLTLLNFIINVRKTYIIYTWTVPQGHFGKIVLPDLNERSQKLDTVNQFHFK